MSESTQERNQKGRSFVGLSLAGARFEDVNLGGASFENVNMGDCTIRNANLSGASIADANLTGMTIYGIRIDRLIEAELDRRDPERCRLRMENPHDPACVRRVRARTMVVREAFIAMLRSTDATMLTTRPAERAWSALECVRHLVFTLNYYLNKEISRSDGPWSPVGLLPGFLVGQDEFATVGSDPDADLETVLAEWERLDRQVATLIAGITATELLRGTSASSADLVDVGGVLRLFAEHELLHIRQAERALAAASSRC